MNLESHHINYIQTLERFTSIEQIPISSSLRKPFLENVLFPLTIYTSHNLGNQLNSVESINSLDISFYLLSFYQFQKEYKSILRRKLNLDQSLNKSILQFAIQYFQFYMIITEFIYSDYNPTTLSQDIFYIIHPNENVLKEKMNKLRRSRGTNELVRLVQLNNLYVELWECYRKLINDVFEKLLDKQVGEKNVKNSFIQFVFQPWYQNLKQTQQQQPSVPVPVPVEPKQQKKKSFLQRFFCNPEIDN